MIAQPIEPILPGMTSLFSFHGTTNRQGWWLAELASLIVGLVGFTLLFASYGLAGLAMLSLCAWLHLAACAKRFRDHGFSPLWTFVWFFPWMGWLAQIIVCGIMPSARPAGFRHRRRS